MKQSSILAIAALGIFSACSQNDVEDFGASNTQSELVPIEIGVSNAGTKTRGTGTVGGLAGAADNVWAGQQVNVFMFNRNTVDLAKFVYAETDGKAPEDIFNDQPMVTPTTGVASGVASIEGNVTKYYPVNDRTATFDFWAYHLDDAKTAGVEPTFNTELNTMAIDYTIDGSQDVMFAKADQTTDCEGKCLPEKAYSAFAARKDVQPTLTFKHLLTRFVVEAKAGNRTTGNPDAEGHPVTITDLKIYSANTGQLVYDAANDTTYLAWATDETGEELDSVALLAKEREDAALVNAPLVPMTEKTLTWLDGAEGETGTSVPVQLGEALLVQPGKTAYRIVLELKQDKYNEATGTYEPITFTMDDHIRLADNAAFKMGNSYKVNVTVYGLNEIVITTALSPWEDGGEAEPIDPDVF